MKRRSRLESVRVQAGFFRQVYVLTRGVPEGFVTTYGAIATMLGMPGRARQVGWALASLPDGHDVPAHRVVNRSGILTGELAFGPHGVMRALLEAEGVTFLDDGRVDLRRHLYQPYEGLLPMELEAPARGECE
jgi:methylated-DNA-protein-cysteine methyltransferase-like protein